MPNGTVAKWLNHKGIGFITPEGETEGENDLLVHHTEIQQEGGDGFKTLKVGAKVEYKVGNDPKNTEKKVAVTVTAVGGGDCEAKAKGQGKRSSTKGSRGGKGKGKKAREPKHYTPDAEKDGKKDGYDPVSLAKALESKILTITFTKRDETERTMNATLKKDKCDEKEHEKLPTLYAGENSEENMNPWTTRNSDTVVTVWDTEAEESDDKKAPYWRTIRWDSIKKIA